MKKIEKIQWLISDLLDLKEYYEQLEHAILLENKETIANIKKCINDFDKNAMLIQLIEILEKEGKMSSYFYKLVKAFAADQKNKNKLSFSDFKRGIVWNPEYGYIVYNHVRGYTENEYLETLKEVQNENN